MFWTQPNLKRHLKPYINFHSWMGNKPPNFVRVLYITPTIWAKARLQLLAVQKLWCERDKNGTTCILSILSTYR